MLSQRILNLQRRYLVRARLKDVNVGSAKNAIDPVLDNRSIARAKPAIAEGIAGLICPISHIHVLITDAENHIPGRSLDFFRLGAAVSILKRRVSFFSSHACYGPRGLVQCCAESTSAKYPLQSHILPALKEIHFPTSRLHL